MADNRYNAKSHLIHIRVPVKDYEIADRRAKKGRWDSVADYYRDTMGWYLNRKHNKKAAKK